MGRYFLLFPIHRLTDRPTDRLTDRPTDRQTDRPTDRQTDSPTHRFTCFSIAGTVLRGWNPRELFWNFRESGIIMGQRRRAREVALQILYQMEVGGGPPYEAIPLFYGIEPDDEDQRADVSSSSRPFAERLVCGVFQHRDDIDAMIGSASENWRLERMSIIDRNVLRIAIFEMLYCPEIPLKVSVNEAIDLGKLFGSPDSGGFINGVLDHLLPQARSSRGEEEGDRPRR
jgi:transcription antitermination protein NusB